ncbi:LacI family DNA-binding transcriptional regulator [Sphingobacterium paramultivorum]|uniref:LacI family DNA-binding transcriptional regulator n=1 Tax=Sphingobacterium paramultivorum TaxID=2886510 RepID=A0A7G5DXB8_9SPHI|nr:LacI family DNA-binding transcriptional regulator [Sphingobacterium paramultivorum]QMV66393.1 LacI family DNA-binding transcriptional regulator [Sphingobacterium paramultivorum]WSO15183.1 LacI family DNA-binding transcriptional regulator [Sphingobacterium paramultivorum]
MQHVTIKEIAKALNLSFSTVSRSLNDNYQISEKTKTLVRDYASSVNYIPNLAAKTLKTGISNSIAVVVPFLSSPFFVDFFEEITMLFSKTDYNVILLQTFNNPIKECEALDVAIQNRVAAIIISPVHDDSNCSKLAYIQKQVCPVVLFDRTNHRLETHKIGVRHEREIAIAAKQLLKQGCKNILLLCCKGIGANDARIAGIRSAFLGKQEPDYSWAVVEIEYNHPNEDLKKQLLRPLKEQKEGLCYDGIIATTDTLTTKVLPLLLTDEGMLADCAQVIGFSNTAYARILNPTWTVFTQPSRQMAIKCYETILELINYRRLQINPAYNTVFLDVIPG